MQITVSATQLIAAICLVITFFCYRKVSQYVRDTQRERARRRQYELERHDALVRGLNGLIDTLVKSSLADSAKLLEGTMKACGEVAKSTIELRDTVASFGKMLGGNASQAESQYTPPADDNEANMVADTFIKAIAGMPLEQARTEAREESEKKMMFASAELSEG